MKTVLDCIAIIVVGMLVVAFVVSMYVNLPIVIRGYQKYGVMMQPADVLKLEALERSVP